LKAPIYPLLKVLMEGMVGRINALISLKKERPHSKEELIEELMPQ